MTKTFASLALLFLAALAVYPLGDSSALYPRFDSERQERQQHPAQQMGNRIDDDRPYHNHIAGTCSFSLVSLPSSRLRLSGYSFSCGQLLVGDSLANGRDHKAIEPLERVKLDISIVETKRKLINIAAKMLFARVVVDTTDAAFENRPDAFYRVSVSHSTAVFAKGMVNRLVGEEQAANAVVGRELVRAERRADSPGLS